MVNRVERASSADEIEAVFAGVHADLVKIGFAMGEHSTDVNIAPLHAHALGEIAHRLVTIMPKIPLLPGLTNDAISTAPAVVQFVNQSDKTLAGHRRYEDGNFIEIRDTSIAPRSVIPLQFYDHHTKEHSLLKLDNYRFGSPTQFLSLRSIARVCALASRLPDIKHGPVADPALELLPENIEAWLEYNHSAGK